MWLVATYAPTSLFSLRYSNATTAGAKSLLMPSPYTIKMALLVAAIRLQGKEWAHANFVWIRGMAPIQIRPSKYAVVNRCFLKFQSKKSEKGTKPRLESGEIDPNYVAPIGYSATVGFREYVHLQGPIEIAFPLDDLAAPQRERLRQLLPQISTFGKRGSLFQFLGFEERTELSEDFSQHFQAGRTMPNGVIHPLDEMAPSLTFEKVDVTNKTNEGRIDKRDRPSQLTIIPLTPHQNAANWASYRRTV